MSNCPVCQTEYVEGQLNSCSSCGWDLTPYPLTFGLPDELVEKEQAKLAWAKDIWVRCLQVQQEQSSQIQSQLISFNQEKLQLQSQLEQLKQEKTSCQYQLKLANLERSHIAKQLEQVFHRVQKFSLGQSSDLLEILSDIERRINSIESLLKLAKKLLSRWIPYLTLELAYGLTHIAKKSQVTEQIHQLLESFPSQQQEMSHSYKVALVSAIKSALEVQEKETTEKIKERLSISTENNPIAQVDALLQLYDELKQRGILNRDLYGDIIL